MFVDLGKLTTYYFTMRVLNDQHDCCEVTLDSKVLPIRKIYLSEGKNRVPSKAWKDIYTALSKEYVYKVLYLNRFPDD